MFLQGIRVLDLTQYLSGPSATQLLAGIGADVIKIELGPDGDASRSLPAIRDGRSAFFVQQNRGKRSVCVDFSDPAGHQLVRDLAAKSDVVVENFGAGVLEKRGLDYASLSADHPDLVMASISAFGKTGSKSHLPGYDIIGQAYSGVMHLTGEPDGSPLTAGAGISDCSAGLMVFAAVGHALFHRDRTGEGQHIDVSLVEPLFHMHALALQMPSVLGPEATLSRVGRHHGAVPPTGCYRGPDGYVVIQVLTPQWDRFCQATAGSGIGEDPRFTTHDDRVTHRQELALIVEAWMQTFPSDEAVLARLEQYRCPAAPVIDPAEAADHPWFSERGALKIVDDPELGEIKVPGFPLKFSGMDEPAYDKIPAPNLGQHTNEILSEVLDYDDSKIDEMRAAGTIS